MSKPKTAERPGIVIYLGDQHTKQVEDICEESVAGIPGARLSKSAWATQIVMAELERRRALRAAATQPQPEGAAEPAPEAKAAPKKKAAG